MRKVDLVKVGDELYEVIHKVSAFKFNTDITGEKADILKKWIGAEKILRNHQTNEYVFVNLIPELETYE
jgi:hypothetical protein